MSINVTIQSGRPTSKITLSPEAEKDVYKAYLTAMRSRFKAEVKRLTSGEMKILLDKGHSTDSELLSFIMSYVYAWHWLQQNVHIEYQQEVLASFLKAKQGFLIEMILSSRTMVEFIGQYIDYWLNEDGVMTLQKQQVLVLLQAKGDKLILIEYIESVWTTLGVFKETHKEAYKDLAKEEKQRYADMLGEEDKKRLALLDQLPNVELPKQYDKIGIIPAMGCPQTCRHCMFIFRPLMKNTEDPTDLYEALDPLASSVLFTGGDLTKQLSHFYHAIDTMKNVTTFAILLNGDFADSRDVCNSILSEMDKAIQRRHITWPKARVMLQISFDEFHQEVVVDRHANLTERIPVTKIANIVEAAPKYSDSIQLCLLHKQVELNFSMDLFKKGVFSRLVNELGRRGHQVEILSSAPSSRLKRNPNDPSEKKALIKDATFVLTKYPKVHMLLTSTTIDAYGRANTMELHETVNERDLLDKMLSGEGVGGESFDMDIMYWFNGWATLFSAVHVCLGNVLEEGLDVIRQRREKDPLSKALNDFDLRLLDYYREERSDLDDIVNRSTSPHHLFHTITEDATMRLHMTERLLQL